MKFTILELNLGTKRQIFPRPSIVEGRVLRRFGCPEKITMTIPRLFLDIFFSNCKSLQWSEADFSLHYLTYEIISFLSLGVRRQFESLGLWEQQKEKTKKKWWQLFSSYINMELNYILKMQRKWVTLIETSVIVTTWLIALFSDFWKHFLFSKPFPLFFLFFSKLLGFFCTSAKPMSVPGSYSGVEPIWLPVSEK